MGEALYPVIGVGVFILIVIIVIFNNFVYKKNRVLNAFSSIDVMLKKRYDLIPNLVATVKGYAKHEKEVFERVTELRQRAMQPGVSDDTKVMLAGQIAPLLGRLMGVVEDYPELKADTQFTELQRSLNELEDAIQNARRYYNAIVRDYNTRTQSVPDVFVAQVGRLTVAEFFELEDEAQRAVPEVDFGAGDE